MGIGSAGGRGGAMGGVIVNGKQCAVLVMANVGWRGSPECQGRDIIGNRRVQ